MFYFPVYALFHYYPEQVWWHIALTAVLLAVGVALTVLFYKKGKISKSCMGWGIALWVYTVFLLFITVIGRYSFEDYRARLIPFESYREYLSTGSLSELRGIIGNVLMFIPFSFLCAQFVYCLSTTRKRCRSIEDEDSLSGKKVLKINPILFALLASIFLTVLLEILQYITRTGTFEFDDLMHNTIGTVVGILLWMLMTKTIIKESGGKNEHS